MEATKTQEKRERNCRNNKRHTRCSSIHVCVCPCSYVLYLQWCVCVCVWGRQGCGRALSVWLLCLLSAMQTKDNAALPCPVTVSCSQLSLHSFPARLPLFFCHSSSCYFPLIPTPSPPFLLLSTLSLLLLLVRLTRLTHFSCYNKPL